MSHEVSLVQLVEHQSYVEYNIHFIEVQMVLYSHDVACLPLSSQAMCEASALPVVKYHTSMVSTRVIIMLYRCYNTLTLQKLGMTNQISELPDTRYAFSGGYLTVAF